MKRFRKVYIEITNICNMHCSFCPTTKRAKATMSAEDFEYIASQVKNYTDYVYLHVKGEPLLNPELNKILNICSENNLKINISTNGTLLENKWELLKGIRQLNVSLHSFENTDEKSLEKYIINVLNACDKLSKDGVIIRYKLWNNQSNTKDNNAKILNIIEDRYKIKISETSYAKDIKINSNMFLSIKSPFKWPNLQDKQNIDGKCYGLRQQIAILVDGTVVPCCVDNDADIPLGNIFNTSLENILNSEKAQELKKGFENNKSIAELCKKCEYKKYV